mgnify:CR=1 FL=1
MTDIAMITAAAARLAAAARADLPVFGPGAVAADAQVRLRVIYEPTFAYSTHQDYDGNARLPALTTYYYNLLKKFGIQP